MKDIELEQDKSLPFGEGKQEACLGFLITEKEFFLGGVGKIQPEWFNDPLCQRIWSAIVNFYQSYKRQPTKEEILETPSIAPEDVKIKTAIEVKVKKCLAQKGLYGLDTIIPRLTEWMKARTLKTKIESAAVQWNNGKYEDSLITIKKGARSVEDISFENKEEKKFDNYTEFFESCLTSMEGALTFGLTAIDRLIVPQSTRRGATIR